VLVSIGALALGIFFYRQLKAALQTGVVRSTHGPIDRGTQPREYWLFVTWLIALIIMLIAFVPIALLVALGYLPI